MSEQPGSPVTKLARHWPWVAAAVAYVLVVTQWVGLMTEVVGEFIYGLDDPYIHMSIAKNLAAHGVFGVTPDGFTGSSSSPLWTLLLAAIYKVTGPAHDAPLWFNLLEGSALLFVASEALFRLGVAAPTRFLVLVAVAVVAPLPTLAVAGLEHTQHLLTHVLFCLLAVDTAVNGVSRRKLVLTSVAAMALVGTRYEGAFAVAAAFLILWHARQRVAAVVVSAAGALPPILYAAVSLSKGWYAVPNSVLLKGASRRPLGFFGTVAHYYDQLVSALYGAPYHLVLFALVIATLLRRTEAPERRMGHRLLVIYVLIAPVHLTFAKLGYFHRYDAYLLAFGVFALAMYWLPGSEAKLLWPAERGRRALAATAMLLAVFPLAFRSWTALKETPIAPKNIFDQQRQMARIVAAYPGKKVITLHDIGAVTFFNDDARIVDIWGLASLEAAKRVRAGKMNAATIEELSNAAGAEIAMVYEAWYPRSIPKDWIRVARMRIQNNVVCGADTVSFYGTTPETAAKLRETITTLMLPTDVTVALDSPSSAP